MSRLLDGKTALVMGVANRWSIAWAVARAFAREGARLIFTYQGDRQEKDVRELAGTLPGSLVFPCDVAQDDDLARLAAAVASEAVRVDALCTASLSPTVKTWEASSWAPRDPGSRWRWT